MKLENYLRETGENPSQFAKRIDCSPSTITRLLPKRKNGRRQRDPSFDLIEKIANGTRGYVMANDFMRKQREDYRNGKKTITVA
jgi:transcriptional regulator with XRE-family HTH domain